MKNYLEVMLERKQFKDLTDEDYLELAKILEKEHGKPFNLEQAKEVADGLLPVALRPASLTLTGLAVIAGVPSSTPFIVNVSVAVLLSPSESVIV